MGSYNLLYELANEGWARASPAVFAADSVVASGGGAKGIVLPDDWQEPVKEFFGVDRLVMGYGMSEVSAFHVACELGRYHVQPWMIPFVLDPDTDEPAPREGVQVGGPPSTTRTTPATGVAAPATRSSSAGSRAPAAAAACTSARTSSGTPRSRGDDRITCAATQQLQHEAIDFLKGFEA